MPRGKSVDVMNIHSRNKMQCVVVQVFHGPVEAIEQGPLKYTYKYTVNECDECGQDAVLKPCKQSSNNNKSKDNSVA